MLDRDRQHAPPHHLGEQGTSGERAHGRADERVHAHPGSTGADRTYVAQHCALLWARCYLVEGMEGCAPDALVELRPSNDTIMASSRMSMTARTRPRRLIDCRVRRGACHKAAEYVARRNAAQPPNAERR